MACMRKVDQETINIESMGKCEPRKCEFQIQKCIPSSSDVALMNVTGDSWVILNSCGRCCAVCTLPCAITVE